MRFGFLGLFQSNIIHRHQHILIGFLCFFIKSWEWLLFIMSTNKFSHFTLENYPLGSQGLINKCLETVAPRAFNLLLYLPEFLSKANLMTAVLFPVSSLLLGA